MTVTVSEIAQKLRARFEGDGSARITGMAGVEEAGAGDITFLSTPRYASAVARTGASAVIVNDNWKGTAPCPVIRVQNPDKAFAEVAFLFSPPPVQQKPGVHPSAVVARNVELGKGVGVGPHCVLESGVKVGDRTMLGAGCYIGHGSALGKNCRLYPHVSVREYSGIGNRVVIHDGVVIGSDGFGYFQDKGAWQKIPQVGTVEIGDDVEIGANVTIDRARFGKTRIGRGVKIDNLVQIAHNVQVGDHTAMAAQVGISGSTTLGKHVQLGGQAGLGGHLSVGDTSVIGGRAAVTKDVPPGSFVSGYPAMPHRKAKRIHAHVMRLPELGKKLAEMEKRIVELENKRDAHGREEE